ncbi:MAG TPA: hypothetical protein DD473_02720 [Planctomycetaceae bacterium]|nr:hypothetical protein [Planctomycetaceae bacterium]|tara:strand:- start:425 stop:898 length:474 start_codon:yes stop_codon:yes gene_type:complete
MKRYGVLIKSDRALIAESEGRFPLMQSRRILQSKLRKEHGIKATIYGCGILLRKYGFHGEWHHIGRYAKEVEYYDIDSVVDRFPDNKLAIIAMSTKPTKEVIERMVRIEWWHWYGAKNRRKYEIQQYEGLATIKGEWIYFKGQRKLMTGNYIQINYL